MAVGYEILPNLDTQPYYAYVDLEFGGHKFPNVPPEYLKSVSIQDVSGEGASVTMTLLDKYGDEIEELLYRSVTTDNYITFGHKSGKQSTRFQFNLMTYTLDFGAQGTVLTVAGISHSVYQNLQTDTVDAGSNPSDAVRKLCDDMGLQYDSESIVDSVQVSTSEGPKEFKLVKDHATDYINQEIAPYAQSSDGKSGYRFYIDHLEDPPKAYFKPVEVSNDEVKTFIYRKGINSTVISFNVSSEFVLSGAGALGITSVLEANQIDPITKLSSELTRDINDVGRDVNGEYSHIDSNQSTEVANTSGLSLQEASIKLNYRMTVAMNTFEADLVIVGDPTIKLGNEIRVIVLTERNSLHHVSGRFLVTGVSHNISSGILVTTLRITKKEDIDGIELKSYRSLYK